MHLKIFKMKTHLKKNIFETKSNRKRSNLVMQRLSRLSFALFTSAKCAKVFDCLWCDGFCELHFNAASFFLANFDVKEDARVARLAHPIGVFESRLFGRAKWK